MPTDRSSVAPSRRDEILGIAARLFADEGYHGTSMRRIADAAGVRPASLYSHFENKEAMFTEVVAPYFADLLPAIDAVASSSGAGAERLAAMVQASIDIGLRHRDAFLALANDWNHIQRVTSLGGLVERRDHARATWDAALAAGIADGSLRADLDRDATLWILFSVLAGMVDGRYAGAGSEPPAPPTDFLLAVLRAGLGSTGGG